MLHPVYLVTVAFKGGAVLTARSTRFQVADGTLQYVPHNRQGSERLGWLSLDDMVGFTFRRVGFTLQAPPPVAPPEPKITPEMVDQMHKQLHPELYLKEPAPATPPHDQDAPPLKP